MSKRRFSLRLSAIAVLLIAITPPTAAPRAFPKRPTQRPHRRINAPGQRQQNHPQGKIDSEMNTLLLYEEWGDWQTDGDLFLRYHPMGYPKFLYEIDLKRITSTTALLDALFSVQRKGWATDKALNDLEHAFQDLFNWCAAPAKTDTTSYWEKRLGIASSWMADLEWKYSW